MLNGLTKSVGAKVVVSPPDIHLMPEEFGFNVSPNTKTNVVLAHRTFERLPAPYTSDCIPDWSHTPYRGAITRSSVYTMEVISWCSRSNRLGYNRHGFNTRDARSCAC